MRTKRNDGVVLQAGECAKPSRQGRPASGAGRKRMEKRQPENQAEVTDLILAGSRRRVRSLPKQTEGQRKTEIHYNGRIVPPVVRLAMERGGFATPDAVANDIRNGNFKLTGSKYAGSTVAGIGTARFLELCNFFDIDPQALPDAIPIERRIASRINDGTPLDHAFAEVVRSNVFARQTIKLVARLTRELTPEGLCRLQDWGTGEIPVTSDCCVD